MIRQLYVALIILACLVLPGVNFAAEPETDPEAAYRNARRLSFDGQYRQAIAIYSRLLAEHPDNPDYLLGMGLAWLWSGDPAQAIPWLEKGAGLAPDYEDLQRALARAREQNRQPKKSVLSLKLANRLEYLSNNDHDWRDSSATLQAKYDDGRLAAISFVNSKRFGLEDNTVAAEAYLPVDDKNYIYGEIRYSGSHHVLPKTSLHLQLTHSFLGGWGVIGGYKHVKYTESGVNLIDLGAEYYYSNFRFGYTSIISDSNSAGGALSHRFQAGYTFESLSNIQFAVSTGSEVEKPVNARSIIKTDFTTYSLWGEILLNRSWTFHYALGYTDLTVNNINDSNRKFFNLGIQYHF